MGHSDKVWGGWILENELSLKNARATVHPAVKVHPAVHPHCNKSTAGWTLTTGWTATKECVSYDQSCSSSWSPNMNFNYKLILTAGWTLTATKEWSSEVAFKTVGTRCSHAVQYPKVASEYVCRCSVSVLCQVHAHFHCKPSRCESIRAAGFVKWLLSQPCIYDKYHRPQFPCWNY